MKVRVLVQRAILLARDLGFCSSFLRRYAQNLVDRVEYFGNVVEHLIVPESKHSIVAGLQERGTGFILLRLIGVLASVELDDQAPFNGAEVGDVDADRVLTSEFDCSRPTASQVSPQDPFGVGLFAAESAGVLLGSSAGYMVVNVGRREMECKVRGEQNVEKIGEERNLESRAKDAR